MRELPHLQLVRINAPTARRKRGSFVPNRPSRSDGHGKAILKQVEDAVSIQKAAQGEEFVNPSRILRVKMDGLLHEDDWRTLGMTLLSSDKDGNIVLFSTEDDIASLKNRLNTYHNSVPKDGKEKSYASFVEGIESVRPLMPKDRIGSRFQDNGIKEVQDFDIRKVYTVDIELWNFSEDFMRREKANEIGGYITDNKGYYDNVYVGPAITMIRARVIGETLTSLLSMYPEISFIDLPPEPDLGISEVVGMTINVSPKVSIPDDDIPTIGILDSGINDHPFLSNIIVGRTAFPAELGTADIWGHGTRVGGVAVFGNLDDCSDKKILHPSAKLVSAKILTDQGKFYEEQTILQQTRDAISALFENYKCRIFIVALGDRDAKYKPGWVGPWAATLDELARKFDILVFVSAGNRIPRSPENFKGEKGSLPKYLEGNISDYPSYLLDIDNRIFEPAGASNVVTVGALANGSGIGADDDFSRLLRPVTEQALQPSPFSRRGPGAGGVQKPDFVDIGGTVVFNPVSAKLEGAPKIPEAGLVTLNHNFATQDLLTTACGTSYAAPMLANKAANLIKLFPNASANLIRALIVTSSGVPEECHDFLKLNELSDEQIGHICGHGTVDIRRAAYSNGNRVVLYSDDSIEIDGIYIYPVPIPSTLQRRGIRSIRVSLAFDPPVRHTRSDYIGTRMNFRLLRGCDYGKVHDHFRARSRDEEEVPSIDGHLCSLLPGPKRRDRQTLQTASVDYRNDTSKYGDRYYLVVRCEGGWARHQEVSQKFAVVVELSCPQDIELYEQVKRVQVGVIQRLRYRR